jgi:hypothetical protein
VAEAAGFALERFEPLLGSAFTLRTGEGEPTALPARLVEARAGGRPGTGGRQPFSLTFEGPPQPLLPQRIYRVEHPRLEAMDLFLVPVGRSAAGLHYQAVFG